MGALVASRVVSAMEPHSSTYAFALNGAAVSLMAFLGSVCGGFLPSVFARRAAESLASAVPYAYALWAAVIMLVPGIAVVLLSSSTVFAAHLATIGRRP